MKLFPFLQKELLKKEQYVFLKDLQKKITDDKIEEESKPEPTKMFDHNQVQATIPQHRISNKEVRELLSSKFNTKLMSMYYSMKEMCMKVPQSFKINTKNNYMTYKESTGDKQNYYKFTSNLNYNFSEDLGIFKKFFKR
jgi:hypothetical protein